MTDKRLALRNHFQEKENQMKADQLFASRTKQLSEIEETIIKAIKHLVKFIDGKTTKTEVVNQLKSISTPDIDKVVKVVEKLDNTTTANKIDLKPLQGILEAIKTELKAIPKELPEFEQKEEVKVTNLKEIVFDTSELEKAIKALDLKVDVKAPIINTEKVELKPLQGIMLDLLKAVNKQKPTESVKVSNLKDIPGTDLSKVEKKLDTANKHLKEIVDKPVGGGGGGGGNGTPYIDGSGIAKNVTLVNGRVPVDVDMATEGIATEATLRGFVDIDITSTTYDASGNLTQMVQTDGTNTKTSNFAYDASGNLSTRAVTIT